MLAGPPGGHGLRGRRPKPSSASRTSTTDVMASLKPLLPSGVRIAPLSDTYPAGDEFILVHDITGKIIPPGGLPKDVGAAVANVETLVNIGLRPSGDAQVPDRRRRGQDAGHPPGAGRPVVRRGDRGGGRRRPWRPYAILLGGVMMGRLADSPDAADHQDHRRDHRPARHPPPRPPPRRRSWRQIARIGRSACDQCRFCTEMCPRYLLGHPIEPHAAMRALGFTEPPNPTIAGTPVLLRVQPLHPLRLPRGPGPQERLRGEQAASPGSRGLVVQGAARGRPGPPPGRGPPRADQAPHGPPGAERASGTWALWSSTSSRRSGSCSRSSSTPGRRPSPPSRPASG